MTHSTSFVLPTTPTAIDPTFSQSVRLSSTPREVHHPLHLTFRSFGLPQPGLPLPVLEGPVESTPQSSNLT